MSEPPASSGPRSGTKANGKRAWLERMSASLAGFAVGWAIDDFKSTLGFHGLAGAVAVAAVVTAATWIRGLHENARLRRKAPWLFLIPAAPAASVAAFSTGPTASILTAASAMLAIGAIIAEKELQSAVRLLAGASIIALGATSFALFPVALDYGDMLGSAAVIATGTALIAGGAAVIAARGKLGYVANCAFGASIIVGGASFIADGDKPGGTTVIATGAAIIVVGAATTANRAKLFAVAANAGGAVAVKLSGTSGCLRSL